MHSRVAVQSLHTFAGLLGEVDTPTPTSAFWDRLCAATCRLAGVDRALVFVYDDARQDVRAVGSHGMARELFGSVHVGMAPVAQRALETDSVVVVQAHHGDPGLPREYVELLELRTVLCTPMSAGGFWYGVLLTDRGTEEFEPDADQLELHWTVGKTAALAVAARTATRQGERARALTDRIDLARDVHDGVIQRLFGVSLALSAAGDMPAAVRERCRPRSRPHSPSCARRSSGRWDAPPTRRGPRCASCWTSSPTSAASRSTREPTSRRPPAARAIRRRRGGASQRPLDRLAQLRECGLDLAWQRSRTSAGMSPAADRASDTPNRRWMTPSWTSRARSMRSVSARARSPWRVAVRAATASAAVLPTVQCSSSGRRRARTPRCRGR